MSRFARLAALTFGLVFVVGVLANWIYRDLLRPPVLSLNYDPEFAYFATSLGVFLGHRYGFVDHPGTPVSLIGTALFALTAPFTYSSAEGFVLYQLQHPRLFLTLAHLALAVGSVVTGYLLVRCALPIRRGVDLLAAVGLAAFFFAIYPFSFRELGSWSHNSFAFPAATLVSLIMLRIVSADAPLTNRRLVYLGVSAGLLTSLQIFVGAWVVGALVAVAVRLRREGASWGQAMRAAVWVAVSAAVSFVALTIPPSSNYLHFIKFQYDVLTHTGRYGNGEPGVVTLVGALDNLVFTFRAMPFLVTAMVLLAGGLVAVLGLRRHEADRGLWAVSAGLLVQVVVLFLGLLKAPDSNYLMWVAAIMPVELAVLFRAFRPRIATVALLMLVVTVGYARNLQVAMIRHNQELAMVGQAQAAIEPYLTTANLVLFTYSADLFSRCHPLWWGNDWANHVLDREIATFCSNELTLSVWSDTVMMADGTSKPPSQVPWDVIVTADGILREFPRTSALGRIELLDGRSPDYGRLAVILPR